MMGWKNEQLKFRLHRSWLGTAAILLSILVGTQKSSQAQNGTVPATQPAQQKGQSSSAEARTAINAPGNAPPNAAQQQPATNAQQNGAYTITTVVNEVNLIFTVTDKHGHFIRNLNESDFSLLDNHMEPAEVYSFTQQTNLPLRVGLMIDTSSSIRSRFAFEQNAAVEFLLSVLRPQVDKAFVMGFDVTPDVTQGYTNKI